jgi:pimeloyl-ACP methyl ester carboxylesterase
MVLSGMLGSRLAPAWACPRACWPTVASACWGRPPRLRSIGPSPQTTALGVADDGGVLCAAVSLERVAVLGISVGAPFALACAVRLPQRVGVAAAVQPDGP